MIMRAEFERYFGKKDWRLQRKVYGEFLAQHSDDPRIVVLDADLSSSTQTSMFKKKCPERFFNCGIAESNVPGVAAGLAIKGKIPFISTFATFVVGKEFEQIRQSIAYSNLPVKIIATHRGCFTGEDGYSHHCIHDIALMRAIPGINIAVPCDSRETTAVLERIVGDGKPWYVGLVRGDLPTINEDSYTFDGKIKPMLSLGNDVNIFSYGPTLYISMIAAKLLEEKEGIKSSVYNVSCIRPLDETGIEEETRACKLVATVEDHLKAGGLGEIVASVISKNAVNTKQTLIALDNFTRSGSPEQLYTEYGLSPGKIYHRIKEDFISFSAASQH